MVRLGWDMELDVTLKLCGFSHGSQSCASVNGAFLSLWKHGVYGPCVISLYRYNETFCATFRDWHWLRNHLFHNSLRKPLFNFLSHFLISFDGSLLVQHGVLMCRMSFYISTINTNFMPPVIAIEKCVTCVAWGKVCGIFALVMTWFQHALTK